MSVLAQIAQWILGFILIASSLGVILSKKPIHASLSFLLSLLVLAVLYLQLSAEFIAVMQVLVYAGAILVIFVFVIVLFQDAYQHIHEYQPRSQPSLLFLAAAAFFLAFAIFGGQFIHLPSFKNEIPKDFGTVQSLGRALYIDFFFPFEATIMLFLTATVGALYIAKKEK